MTHDSWSRRLPARAPSRPRRAQAKSRPRPAPPPARTPSRPRKAPSSFHAASAPARLDLSGRGRPLPAVALRSPPDALAAFRAAEREGMTRVADAQARARQAAEAVVANAQTGGASPAQTAREVAEVVEGHRDDPVFVNAFLRAAAPAIEEAARVEDPQARSEVLAALSRATEAAGEGGARAVARALLAGGEALPQPVEDHLRALPADHPLTLALTRALSAEGLAGPVLDVEAAAVDAAAQVQAALSRGPNEAAEVFAAVVAEHADDPAFLNALARAAGPALGALGQALSDPGVDAAVVGAALDALDAAATRLPPAEAGLVADQFVAGLPYGTHPAAVNPVLLEGLGRITAAGGIRFGAEALAALQRAGRTQQVQVVDAVLREEISRITDSFSSAADEVETLQGQLAVIQSSFAGLGDDAAIAQGVEAVRGNHAAAYEALEAAAAALGGLLDGLAALSRLTGAAREPGAIGAPAPLGAQGALAGASLDALDQLDRLAQTEHGAGVLAQALEDSGAGRFSFLGTLENAARALQGHRRFADSLVDVLFRATAATGAVRLAGGDLAGVAALFRGLERHGELFTRDPARLRALVDFLNGASPDDLGTEAFQREFNEHLGRVRGGITGESNGGASLSFAALGIVLSTVSLVRNGRDLAQDPELAAALQLTADALGLSRDTALLLRSLGAEGGLVGALTQTGLGRGLGVAGSIFGAVRAVEHLREGRNLEAGTAALTSLGGLLLAVGSGPVGVVGGLLLGVGAVGTALVNVFRGWEENEHFREDARAFLGALGFTEEQAQVLGRFHPRNDPPFPAAFISELVPEQPRAQAQFVEELRRLTPDQLEQYLEFGDAAVELRLSPGDFTTLLASDDAVIANHNHPQRVAARAYGLADEAFFQLLEQVPVEDLLPAFERAFASSGYGGIDNRELEGALLREVIEAQFPALAQELEQLAA